MELASMLEGGRFTDRPRSVCPVIGAFLRGYNDLVDDRRRADLYACAAMAVGTRCDELRPIRTRRLVAWALERRANLRPLGRSRTRSLLLCLSANLTTGADQIGWISARVAAAGGPEAHPQVLALVSELCAMRAPDTRAEAELPTDRAALMSAG